MQNLVTSPVRLLWQALVLPLKVLRSSLGFTFRAGVTVGKLPVKGGAVVSRALGWKLIGALIVGVVLGVRLTHRHDHDHDHGANDIDPPGDETLFDAGVTA